MLSQHFCQMLAAKALRNCTLDKMSAATFHHDWGNTKQMEPQTCLGLSGHDALTSLSEAQSSFDGRCEAELGKETQKAISSNEKA